MNSRDVIQNITDFIFLEHTPQKADIICIPGNSLPEPSMRAAALYREGYAPYVLPSGKYSIKSGRFAFSAEGSYRYAREYETEWDFMADILRGEGVPDSAILREDQSQYTKQNADFSKAVVDALGLTVRTGIICCKAVHARRCLMYYAQAFPETQWLLCPAAAQGIRREDWFLSETATERVLGELSRCGSQFRFEDIQALAKDSLQG